MEFEYDQKDMLSVRIDRKRKFHGTVFLRALGLETDESILRQFYTPVGLTSRAAASSRCTSARGCWSQERLKDRQSRGRRESYPIFAGIKLDAEQIGELDTGQTIDRRRSTSRSSTAPSSSPTSSTSTPARCSSRPTSWCPRTSTSGSTAADSTPVEVFFPDWELVGAILSNTLGQGHHQATPRRR